MNFMCFLGVIIHFVSLSALKATELYVNCIFAQLFLYFEAPEDATSFLKSTEFFSQVQAD